ncbi:hypothetical protein [Bradyrhizobium sp. Leo170]|uniref:hypothetical protein n=1 Tax=Bradyrhizobium sp. Leo170 TaxID=1571199 RepID=UPI00102E2A96|nr:hypothetical protein [Bradyrhizobium sp. Leo170]TAI66398.1 hypothetical protein CWO89_08345 [Bradyrhizobium sp. Leo170]
MINQRSFTSAAVFHDYFAIRGGGERLVLELAQALGASITYGYTTPESYERTLFLAESLDLNLSPLLRRYGLHAPALAFAFARQRARAESIDTRIFSGVCAPFAAPAADRPGRNIYYCHTPPLPLRSTRVVRRRNLAGEEARPCEHRRCLPARL